jgi:hypothetical protein
MALRSAPALRVGATIIGSCTWLQVDQAQQLPPPKSKPKELGERSTS